jgi:tight adherence protein C
MSSIQASLITFALVAIGASALYAALYGDFRSLEEQVSGLAAKLRLASGNMSEEELRPAGIAHALLKLTMQRIPKESPKSSDDKSLSRLMVQAGYRSRNATQVYRSVRVLSAVILAILFVVLGTAIHLHLGGILASAIGGLLFGAMIPQAWISRKARLRQEAIARQLSDVLDLMIVCVETGLGLHESILMVGSKTERNGQEIGSELMAVSREMGSGASLGQALRNLAERTAVEDIKPLTASLIQSEQLGSQIAPALRASSDALRTKRRLKAEEAAQKATIKILFPLVLFVLPAMLLVIVGPAMVNIVHTLAV